jgi:uncharacterized protein
MFHVEHKNITSPCIGRCTTTFDDICKGCGRTWLEVANWVLMSEQEQISVLRRLEIERNIN